jgi:hypothetical protein
MTDKLLYLRLRTVRFFVGGEASLLPSCCLSIRSRMALDITCKKATMEEWKDVHDSMRQAVGVEPA